MFNFIKIEDNVWLNINSITSIQYYPNGNGEFNYLDTCYLIIHTNTNDFYHYEDKKEAMVIIEKLRQHGVFLE